MLSYKGFYHYYVHSIQNIDDEIPIKQSTDKNPLFDEQLLAIQMDDNTEMTVTSDTPLMLEDGYELAIKSIDIDGKDNTVTLSRNRLISLTGDLNIKIADADELRYCILKEVTITKPADFISATELATDNVVRYLRN